ncbi:hypothetical protein Leryth_015545 [Lithospermum erythrorhizon]|nr:hypothetical protein Leryth_015545 [Lithospermum erythrorhizon]
MAALTSVTPHSNFRSSSFLQNSVNDRANSLRTKVIIGSSTKFFSYNHRAIRIQNSAATKPAKSPAEEEWKIKREVLLQKVSHIHVRSVEVKEALRLQKENNFVILDVRPEAEFKEAHPPGAINVQIYRLIKEWTAWDITRRLAFAFFGIFSGTEENPEFMKTYLLVLNGYSNVYHLQGGLYTWFKEELPAEAEE